MDNLWKWNCYGSWTQTEVPLITYVCLSGFNLSEAINISLITLHQGQNCSFKPEEVKSSLILSSLHSLAFPWSTNRINVLFYATWRNMNRQFIFPQGRQTLNSKCKDLVILLNSIKWSTSWYFISRHSAFMTGWLYLKLGKFINPGRKETRRNFSSYIVYEKLARVFHLISDGK